MDNSNMNTLLGTKWFTFYTKVRPWIACFGICSVVVDFIQYPSVYLHNWWLLIYLIGTIAQPILAVIVAFKSCGDYINFVRFVKGVLLYETINMSYQVSVETYVKNVNSELSVVLAIISFVIAFVISYFLWYRLNVKYFEKRILSKTNFVDEIANNYRQKIVDSIKSFKINEDGSYTCPNCYMENESLVPCERCGFDPLHSKGVGNKQEISLQSSVSSTSLFCRKCGTRLLPDSLYCNKCGVKVEVYEE